MSGRQMSDQQMSGRQMSTQLQIAFIAIYRVLSQLQIMSTRLLLHPHPALAASISLFYKSVTW